jgi:replication factor C small subunit
MWTEKYRPKKLDDIIYQEDIVKTIKELVKERELPHMLFAGPAGVGKTTVALCIVNELFGEDWRDNPLFQDKVLQLNASDERGIKTVREKVKNLIEWRSPVGDKVNTQLFKIIILDEADEMTSEAQTALRRMMEVGAETTRFIIICNYLSQIIEPIQSRCVVIRFTRIPKDDVIEHLKTICNKEKVKFEDKALERVYEATEGDLRHAINVIQAASGMGQITVSNVTAALGLAGRSKVGDVLKLAFAGKFNEARAKLLELTQVYGMSEGDFMKYASQEAYEMKLENPGRFAEIMAEYDYRLASGAHPEIQMAALLAQLGRLGKKD